MLLQNSSSNLNFAQRSRSSPAQQATLSFQPSRSEVVVAKPEDPSFGTLERSLAQQDASYALQRKSNDESIGLNKRSVQVSHPENRVLFELTTISNEICRDNMTTVQTSIIPASNHSSKQLGLVEQRQKLLRGSSERVQTYLGHEPEQALMPFTVEGNSCRRECSAESGGPAKEQQM